MKADDMYTPAVAFQQIYAQATDKLHELGIDPAAVATGEQVITLRAPVTPWTAHLDRVEDTLFGDDVEREIESERERLTFVQLKSAYRIARYVSGDDLTATFTTLTAWGWRILIGAPSPRFVSLLEMLDGRPDANMRVI